MRTVLVFTDQAKHLEYRAGSMPLLEEKTVLDFDIQHGAHGPARKPLKISGAYRVSRRVLRYTTSRASLMGLTQYLELEPVQL
ncbi:MAG: hypothetical protein BWY99_01962 [Synergistetes bacterium ADurb.BinA166]|nr:MAG: hypothetical protein BWY99_01962 [Synergistetes bacterium ADurb.BinA166]